MESDQFDQEVGCSDHKYKNSDDQDQGHNGEKIFKNIDSINVRFSQRELVEKSEHKPEPEKLYNSYIPEQKWTAEQINQFIKDKKCQRLKEKRGKLLQLGKSKQQKSNRMLEIKLKQKKLINKHLNSPNRIRLPETSETETTVEANENSEKSEISENFSEKMKEKKDYDKNNSRLANTKSITKTNGNIRGFDSKSKKSQNEKNIDEEKTVKQLMGDYYGTETSVSESVRSSFNLNHTDREYQVPKMKIDLKGLASKLFTDSTSNSINENTSKEDKQNLRTKLNEIGNENNANNVDADKNQTQNQNQTNNQNPIDQRLQSYIKSLDSKINNINNNNNNKIKSGATVIESNGENSNLKENKIKNLESWSGQLMNKLNDLPENFERASESGGSSVLHSNLDAKDDKTNTELSDLNISELESLLDHTRNNLNPEENNQNNNNNILTTEEFQLELRKILENSQTKKKKNSQHKQNGDKYSVINIFTRKLLANDLVNSKRKKSKNKVGKVISDSTKKRDKNKEKKALQNMRSLPVNNQSSHNHDHSSYQTTSAHPVIKRHKKVERSYKIYSRDGRPISSRKDSFNLGHEKHELNNDHSSEHEILSQRLSAPVTDLRHYQAQQRQKEHHRHQKLNARQSVGWSHGYERDAKYRQENPMQNRQMYQPQPQIMNESEEDSGPMGLRIVTAVDVEDINNEMNSLQQAKICYDEPKIMASPIQNTHSTTSIRSSVLQHNIHNLGPLVAQAAANANANANSQLTNRSERASFDLDTDFTDTENTNITNNRLSPNTLAQQLINGFNCDRIFDYGHETIQEINSRQQVFLAQNETMNLANLLEKQKKEEIMKDKNYQILRMQVEDQNKREMLLEKKRFLEAQEELKKEKQKNQLLAMELRKANLAVKSNSIPADYRLSDQSDNFQDQHQKIMNENEIMLDAGNTQLLFGERVDNLGNITELVNEMDGYKGDDLQFFENLPKIDKNMGNKNLQRTGDEYNNGFFGEEFGIVENANDPEIYAESNKSEIDMGLMEFKNRNLTKKEEPELLFEDDIIIDDFQATVARKRIHKSSNLCHSPASPNLNAMIAKNEEYQSNGNEVQNHSSKPEKRKFYRPSQNRGSLAQSETPHIVFPTESDLTPFSDSKGDDDNDKDEEFDSDNTEVAQQLSESPNFHSASLISNTQVTSIPYTNQCNSQSEILAQHQILPDPQENLKDVDDVSHDELLTALSLTSPRLSVIQPMKNQNQNFDTIIENGNENNSSSKPFSTFEEKNYLESQENITTSDMFANTESSLPNGTSRTVDTISSKSTIKSMTKSLNDENNGILPNDLMNQILGPLREQEMDHHLISSSQHLSSQNPIPQSSQFNNNSSSHALNASSASASSTNTSFVAQPRRHQINRSINNNNFLDNSNQNLSNSDLLSSSDVQSNKNSIKIATSAERRSVTVSQSSLLSD